MYSNCYASTHTQLWIKINLKNLSQGKRASHASLWKGNKLLQFDVSSSFGSLTMKKMKLKCFILALKVIESLATTLSLTNQPQTSVA